MKTIPNGYRLVGVRGSRIDEEGSYRGEYGHMTDIDFLIYKPPSFSLEDVFLKERRNRLIEAGVITTKS